ncbi:arginase [Paramagnetospirillum marisnigri]|nr:arginase [Paramagnetospirillum marisnigri]
MTGSGRAMTILGVGCGLGARDGGCADGPRALRRGGMGERLRGLTEDLHCLELQAPLGDAQTVIPRLADHLATLVAKECGRGRFPIVIGGDHSCAMGTWAGLRQAHGAAFRLIWIDAHMDLHTPDTSPSGALHGMPLACLLGLGPPGLARHPPVLTGTEVTLMGVRSWEPEEEARTSRHGIRVMGMAELKRLGLAAALAEATGPGDFGISLDLDAIDPADAPGVGTPAPGGIRADELLDALAPLLASPRCIGLEIAEYNPHHDIDQRTAALVETIVEAAIRSSGDPP